MINEEDLNNIQAPPKPTESIDDFLQGAGVGSRDRALGNMLYGMNHSRITPNIPFSNSTYGWTFFTRPQLNLRTFNIRNVRTFYPLLTEDELSVQRFIRNTLDPRLSKELYIGGNSLDFYKSDIIKSRLVDENNPFIPILSNAVKTVSGWPDEALPTYVSTQGMRREQFGMVDGSFEIYDSFDISVNFDNYINDPILSLFQYWTRYSSLVFSGLLSPYWDMIIENEIDYNTRIYRLTTDSSWRYLNYIGATGAAFPINNSMGKLFDYSKDKPYSEQNKDISIRFKCFGANYNDDILIKEFNQVHGIFNPAYKRYLEGYNSSMVEIPNELRPILNFRGYPYIDPNSYEIKWLINKESLSYKRLIKNSKNSSSAGLEAAYDIGQQNKQQIIV